MPDVAPAPVLAVAHQQRPAPRIEVVLAEGERLLHARPAAPERDDHRAQPPAMSILAGPEHHGDDLVHGRRVGRVWKRHSHE